MSAINQWGKQSKKVASILRVITSPKNIVVIDGSQCIVNVFDPNPNNVVVQISWFDYEDKKNKHTHVVRTVKNFTLDDLKNSHIVMNIIEINAPTEYHTYRLRVYSQKNLLSIK